MPKRSLARRKPDCPEAWHHVIAGPNHLSCFFALEINIDDKLPATAASRPEANCAPLRTAVIAITRITNHNECAELADEEGRLHLLLLPPQSVAPAPILDEPLLAGRRIPSLYSPVPAATDSAQRLRPRHLDRDPDRDAGYAQDPRDQATTEAGGTAGDSGQVDPGKGSATVQGWLCRDTDIRTDLVPKLVSTTISNQCPVVSDGRSRSRDRNSSQTLGAAPLPPARPQSRHHPDAGGGGAPTGAAGPARAQADQGGRAQPRVLGAGLPPRVRREAGRVRRDGGAGRRQGAHRQQGALQHHRERDGLGRGQAEPAVRLSESEYQGAVWVWRVVYGLMERRGRDTGTTHDPERGRKIGFSEL